MHFRTATTHARILFWTFCIYILIIGLNFMKQHKLGLNFRNLETTFTRLAPPWYIIAGRSEKIVFPTHAATFGCVTQDLMVWLNLHLIRRKVKSELQCRWPILKTNTRETSEPNRWRQNNLRGHMDCGIETPGSTEDYFKDRQEEDSTVTVRSISKNISKKKKVTFQQSEDFRKMFDMSLTDSTFTETQIAQLMSFKRSDEVRKMFDLSDSTFTDKRREHLTSLLWTYSNTAHRNFSSLGCTISWKFR